MGKQTGYARYQCDRCAKTAFLQESSVDTRTWYAIHRYSSNQITGGEPDQYTLCSDCFSKYTQLITADDRAFADWMSNKNVVPDSKPSGTVTEPDTDKDNETSDVSAVTGKTE